MTERIATALETPPDYSDAFMNVVASLVAQIQGGVRAKVRHCSDMNYSRGHKIYVCLDGRGKVVNAAAAAAVSQVAFCVSSKGPLYATATLKRTGPEAWAVEGHLPTPPSVAAVHQLLGDHGYEEVPADLLRSPAPNVRNELDNSQANYFEALFTEIL